MLSAPPSSHNVAACTGSGYGSPRAWRTVATWSMLIPSLIMSLVSGFVCRDRPRRLVTELRRHRLDQLRVGTFNHDPTHALGPAVAKQHAPFLAELLLKGRDQIRHVRQPVERHLLLDAHV